MLTNDEKLIENIKATMAMEGFELKEKDISLINQFLDNQITEEQGIDIIKKDIISRLNDKNV
jgi:hypothetical protein